MKWSCFNIVSTLFQYVSYINIICLNTFHCKFKHIFLSEKQHNTHSHHEQDRLSCGVSFSVHWYQLVESVGV